MNQNSSTSNGPTGARAASLSGAPLLTALAALLIALGGLILFLFNPQQHGFYPFCTFYRMTGLLCPGCGSLRALHELLHGHVLVAFRYNPLLVISIPFAIFWAWSSFRRRPDSNAARGVTPFWIWIGMGLLLVFGIVRNLPFFKASMAGF